MRAVKAIGNHYEFSERLVRLMCLSTQPQAANSRRRAKDRHGLAKHFHRHGDVELGNVGHGANSSYPMVSHSSVQLQKDDNESMDDVDDDSMELYLQVKNTVNYFSTDQTQKGMCLSQTWQRQLLI